MVAHFMKLNSFARLSLPVWMRSVLDETRVMLACRPGKVVGRPGTNEDAICSTGSSG
jgi:hypothetical protein